MKIEYVVIAICIVAVASIVVLLMYRKKSIGSPKDENTSRRGSGEIISKQTGELSQSDRLANELAIQVDMLPAEAVSDKSGLVEITDNKVLARVNNLVPHLPRLV
ncbi:hypothetical protein ACLUWA_01845 [Bifidobacterium thermophilum]|uniref:hypothetical protein n=1 Tax=Bifidobacterium thermophilum TaxID=33905 RepID=UPI003992BB69